MNILILGASGLVGGNALAYLSQQPDCVVRGTHFSYSTDATFYFNTADLNDPANAAALRDFAPDVVIHCGALTFVDYCESHPNESHQKTVGSTQQALALAQRTGAALVYISTDYVFDGKQGPYAEEDVVNPICVYGRHKLEAEELVAASGLQYLILRITNVYGHELRGKNFVARLLHQIQAQEFISLQLPYDQYATPINAADIARATYLLLKHHKTGIYHLGSTDYMNRYQLAERVLHKFGYGQAQLTPIATASLVQPAPRPLNGGLLSRKLLSEFPTFRFSSIDEFLTNF